MAYIWVNAYEWWGSKGLMWARMTCSWSKQTWSGLNGHRQAVRQHCVFEYFRTVFVRLFQWKIHNPYSAGQSVWIFLLANKSTQLIKSYG